MGCSLGLARWEVGFHPGTLEPWRFHEFQAAEKFTVACLERSAQWATWKDV